MKKHQIESVSTTMEKATFLESLEDNPYLHWISNNGRLLLYIILGIIILAFIIYRFNSSSHTKAGNDYLLAERNYQLIQNPSAKDEKSQQDALNQLGEILKRQPDLHPKYDGLLAQILLNRNEISQAKEFANLALGRTSEENKPFYTDFTQTTLLIAEKQYAEALKTSLSLKQKMLENAQLPSNERGFGDTLFALNLLRIAILQQELGSTSDELQTWAEWKQYAGLSKEKAPNKNIDSKAFQNVYSQFEEGKLSLINYIDAREKTLKS